MAAAETGRSFDGAATIMHGARYRLLKPAFFRQSDCDRRGIGAARAMRCSVSIRGKANASRPSSRINLSTSCSPRPWPPLISTALAPIDRNDSPARRFRRGRPFDSRQHSASGRFGVTRVESGISDVRKISKPALSSNAVPLVDTITGSRTIGMSFAASPTFRRQPRDFGRAQHADLDGIGTDIVEACADLGCNESGGISWTACTPIVSWAVTAVMAVMA